MKKQTVLARSIASLWLGGLLAAAAWAAGPVAVSPGATTGFAGAGSACPTFSWSDARGAAGYEIVAYAIPEEVAQIGSRPSLDGDPVLRAQVPAGALSWTPPSESCLELGGSYAWTVRALDSGQWSAPALFRVDVGPVVSQIGDALERALSRYLGEEPGRSERPGALASLILDEMAPRPAPPAAVAASQPDNRLVYYLGEQMLRSEALARYQQDPILSLEDWELEVHETQTGMADYAQIVMAVDSVEPDWAFVVAGDEGVMFLWGPSLSDSIDFFTDGTVVIPELRDLRLGPTDSPGTCSTAKRGHTYYDFSLNELCFCDGSAPWRQVDDGGNC